MGIGKHMRDLKKFVAQLAPEGADINLHITKGNHVAVVIELHGRSRTIFAPCTPSDHRSMTNVQRDLRHAVRSMEEANAGQQADPVGFQNVARRRT